MVSEITQIRIKLAGLKKEFKNAELAAENDVITMRQLINPFADVIQLETGEAVQAMTRLHENRTRMVELKKDIDKLELELKGMQQDLSAPVA